MRIIILKLILFFGVFGNSQTGYRVYYETYQNDIPFISNKQNIKKPVSHSRLVFNDSVSFFYGLGDSKRDPMKKRKDYGNKIFHHSLISFKESDVLYEGVANPPGKKEFYIVDTFKTTGGWTFTDESKFILGYNCKKAFRTKEYFVEVGEKSAWFTDSTVVWYTEEIPLPFGPLFQREFPGLVLEIFLQKKTGDFQILVSKMEKDNFTIGISPAAKIVSLGHLNKKGN